MSPSAPRSVDLARCSRPKAIVRLALQGREPRRGLICLAYLVPPSIPFIPLATAWFQYGLFDSPLAADILTIRPS